ncbi:MAG: histidine kinase [Egibacteraceae bacterium]
MPQGDERTSRIAVADALAAVALTAVSLPLLWVPEAQALLPGYRGPTPLAVAVTMATTVPIAWRRRAPVTTLLAVGCAMVGAAALSLPNPGLTAVLALYTVAAEAPRRRALASLAGFAALTLLALVLADAVRHLGTNVVVLAAAWLLGDRRRLDRARTTELESRARGLERARAERASLAVSDERDRIATELRDVLAHSISAMVTQAQASGRTLAVAPERAAAALLTVEESGRAGLLELRRLVGLLRQGESAHPPGDTHPSSGEASTDASRREEPPAQRSMARRARRLRHVVRSGPAALQDAALAAVVLAVELSLHWVVRPEDVLLEGYTGLTLPAVLALTAMIGALVLRRRLPQLVLALTLAGAVTIIQLEAPAQLWAPLIALYTVAAHRERRISVPWLLATQCLAVVLLLAHGGAGFLLSQMVVIGAAWLLGDRQRVRLAYADELEHRSTGLEQARQREAALAVAQERTRIARELHDIVAHSLGVMVVQAGGARRLVYRDPERARQAVEQIIACGRDSLARMRAVFRLLGADRTFAPQPTVDDLPDLLQEFGEAGLRVTIEVLGRRRPLSAGVELSTYRIVQESLTNVLRHAATEHAAVRLDYSDTALTVAITDDGRGPPREPRPGAEGSHGILGMRERAHLVGGSLETGARSGGGFQVTARLPAAPLDQHASTVEPAATAP